MIETRLLVYFLAVAHYRNITKAAKSLYISQATLSKQMMELEHQLGKPLFIRGKRQLTLTSDGLFLQNRANKIINLLESTQSAFQADPNDFSGNITIGTAETNAMDQLACLLASFHDTYPKITYTLISDDADRTFQQLDQGTIDIALMMAIDLDPRYDYLHLNYEHYYGLLIPNDDPLAHEKTIPLSTLESLPLIVPQRSFIGHQPLDALGLDYAKYHVVATYNLIGNVPYLVNHHLGYGLVIDHLVNTTPLDLTFVPIDPILRLPLYIVSRKGFALSDSALALVQWIQDGYSHDQTTGFVV